MASILEKQFSAVLDMFEETEQGLDGYERFLQRLSNAAFVLLWFALLYVAYKNLTPLVPQATLAMLSRNTWYWVGLAILFLASLRLLLVIKRAMGPFKLAILIGVVHTGTTVYNLVFHYKPGDFWDTLTDFIKDLF